MLLAVYLILIGHGELLWSHKMEGGIEMAHGHEQGVHCAPVFQVAHKIDVEILECSLSLVDGIEVEHTLRRMLMGSVAGIDNGHRGHFAGILRSSFDIMPHNYHVGIVGHHEYGILKCFSLGTTGDFGVGKTYNTCAKAVGCGFKTQSCSCRRLKKERRHDLSL